MTPALELIANYACRVGENPLWNPLDKQVYWLDIPEGAIFRYEPTSETHEVFYRGEVTGGFTIQADGALLLFGAKGAVRRLYQGELTTVIDALPGEEHNRFNDVIADPSGRVLCGTMPYGAGSQSGSLYRIELDGAVTKLLDNVRLSNGMGFSPDARTFYHTDSLARTVTQFDYDITTGEIFNPRNFVMLLADKEIPDGLTVDAEGFVWSAIWDGSRLVRYDPLGKIERQINFPVKKVSSLTFGGDDYSDLYVTTAGGDNLPDNGTLAGALFHLRLGIKGKSEFLSRIQISG